MVRIALLLLLSGCVSGPPAPYLEIGVGYTLDKMSDWYLSSEREWTCKHRDTFHERKDRIVFAAHELAGKPMFA